MSAAGHLERTDVHALHPVRPEPVDGRCGAQAVGAPRLRQAQPERAGGRGTVQLRSAKAQGSLHPVRPESLSAKVHGFLHTVRPESPSAKVRGFLHPVRPELVEGRGAAAGEA